MINVRKIVWLDFYLLFIELFFEFIQEEDNVQLREFREWLYYRICKGILGMFFILEIFYMGYEYRVIEYQKVEFLLVFFSVFLVFLFYQNILEVGNVLGDKKNKLVLLFFWRIYVSGKKMLGKKGNNNDNFQIFINYRKKMKYGDIMVMCGLLGEIFLER